MTQRCIGDVGSANASLLSLDGTIVVDQSVICTDKRCKLQFAGPAYNFLSTSRRPHKLRLHCISLETIEGRTGLGIGNTRVVCCTEVKAGTLVAFRPIMVPEAVHLRHTNGLHPPTTHPAYSSTLEKLHVYVAPNGLTIVYAQLPNNAL